ncbi:hypothetical protein U1Q18_040345, partial [Sarracenia purpurea var. burkii]
MHQILNLAVCRVWNVFAAGFFYLQSSDLSLVVRMGNPKPVWVEKRSTGTKNQKVPSEENPASVKQGSMIRDLVILPKGVNIEDVERNEGAGKGQLREETKGEAGAVVGVVSPDSSQPQDGVVSDDEGFGYENEAAEVVKGKTTFLDDKEAVNSANLGMNLGDSLIPGEVVVREDSRTDEDFEMEEDQNISEGEDKVIGVAVGVSGEENKILTASLIHSQ